MAYVPSGLQNLSDFQSFESNQGYLAGETPLLSSSGGSYGGGAEPTGGGAPASTTTLDGTAQTPPSGGAEPEYSGSLFDRSQTSTASGVFDPLQQGLTATTEELRGLGAEFEQGLPATRTWEGVGAQGTLDAAIEGGGSLDPARELLSASYQGPTGLDPQDLGMMHNRQQQLANQASALTTGAGLQNILKLGAPGITPGEVRFEAGRTVSQPGYHAQARQLESQAQNLAGIIGEQAKGAEEAAGERRRGEEQIASKSKGYLESRREGVMSLIDQELRDAKMAQGDTMSQWAKLMGTGDTNLLPEDLRSQFTGTDVQRRRATAEQAWDRIMGQYPDLAQYDPLNLKVSGRGHERYTEPGGSVNDPYFRGDMADWGPLQERQRALEAKFSPGTRASFQGYQPYGETGRYSDVAPMYDYQGPVGSEAPAQPWETPDIRNYLELDYGLDPNRANVSTDQQKEVFNRINTLLGEAERLGEAEPWRAAQIMGNVDAFIQEEERRVEQAGEKRTQDAQDWSNLVGKARRRYNKSQSGIGSLAGALSFGSGFIPPVM